MKVRWIVCRFHAQVEITEHEQMIEEEEEDGDDGDSDSESEAGAMETEVCGAWLTWPPTSRNVFIASREAQWVCIHTRVLPLAVRDHCGWPTLIRSDFVHSVRPHNDRN